MPLPDLTDQFVAESYEGVLHTSNQLFKDNNIATNPTLIYDGKGNPSAMKLGGSGQGIEITGDVVADEFKIIIGNIEKKLIDYIYPIGSVYFSVDSSDPSSKFIGTNWSQISQGKFIVGVGTGSDGTDTAAFILRDNSNGKYKHKLTIPEMPIHTHTCLNFDPTRVSQDIDIGGRQFYYKNPTATTGSAGGDQSHNNIPPGFGLYVWERTL